MEMIFKAIGSIFCHQMVSRTLSAGGRLLPFCARDTGIHTGFFLSALYLFLKSKGKYDRIPPNSISFILAGLMSLTALDGATSYMGLRETTNEIRFITGSLFGMASASFLIPLKGFDSVKRGENPTIRNFYQLFFLLGLITIYGYVILKTSLLPWIMAAAVPVGGFLIFTYKVFTTAISMVKPIRGKGAILAVAISYAAILALLYYISNTLFGGIKGALIN